MRKLGIIIESEKAIKIVEKILKVENVSAFAFFPFIFIRKGRYKMNEVLMNHERIHLWQQIEMLIIPFYILYFIELFKKGYHNVSFEKEAYDNEKNLSYIKKRRLWSFLKYFKN